MNNMKFTLVIRNAYLREPNDIFDIGIYGDRIENISKQILEKGDIEIDAKGNFASPGFVDCHTHMDKSLTVGGERFPKYNEYRPRIIDRIRRGLEYYKQAKFEEIKRHVIEHAYMQISNGTLYTRTHVDVDSIARTKAVKATIAARKELKGLIDIQIVAFAQSGFLPDPESESLVRKSIELGADLVGSLDPATCEHNIEDSLDLSFKIAKDYNVDIDWHIHDRGTLGMYTLERLVQKTLENEYKKRVTASHSYSLADAPSEWLDEKIPMFKKSGLKFITCYCSTRSTMPVKRLSDAGIPIGCASDNVRDFWRVFGNADMVQGAFVETQRLGWSTNQELDLIWNMITTEGAKVLNIKKDYGIKVGKKADIVILNAPSPQWTIIDQPIKQYIIKNGKVIARNGKILPEFKKY